MTTDNDNTQMEEQRESVDAVQVDHERAVDEARRRLEEIAATNLYEPVTSSNINAAIEFARLTGGDTSELNALRTTASTTGWVSLESGSYDNDWGWDSNRTETEAREETDEEKAAKFTERLRIAEELKIKILNIKSKRMSRRRTAILEEMSTRVTNHIDSALAGVTGQSTHDSFVSYMKYLATYMDEYNTNIDKHIAKERLKKKRVTESLLRNKPDMRSKLFCPIGIEYTYHPKVRSVKTNLPGVVPNNSALSGFAGVNIIQRTYTFDLNVDGSPNITPVETPPNVDVNVPEIEAPSNESNEPESELNDLDAAYSDLPTEPTPEPVPEPVPPDPNYDPIAGRRNKTKDKLQTIVFKMSSKIKELQRATGLYSEAKAYADNGVVEVCSPVHRDWRSMRDWYRWMLHQLGSSVTVTNKKKGSGGGHINCAIPKRMKEKFMYNLLVDIGNRPYLNWIFNDPSDNHTANCMWDSKDMQRIYDHVSKNKEKWESNDQEFLRVLSELITLTNSRGYAIRVKSEYHFEFRCFDAIRNERDLEDVVVFVSEYMRSIYSMTVAGHMFDTVGGTTDDLPNFAATARADFNGLLRRIGLEPENYRRFVDRNFEVRRKVYGKNNLI